jgi:hypothetical protein
MKSKDIPIFVPGITAESHRALRKMAVRKSKTNSSR